MDAKKIRRCCFRGKLPLLVPIDINEEGWGVRGGITSTTKVLLYDYHWPPTPPNEEEGESRKRGGGECCGRLLVKEGSNMLILLWGVEGAFTKDWCLSTHE